MTSRPDELRLATYQRRVNKGSVRALRQGEDVLVEAPTGAGKTAMIANIAADMSKGEGEKALILVHRKTIFSQMVGNPKAATQKERDGEILTWAGVSPGTVADEALGGVNTGPSVVVAMVETISRRPELLKAFTTVVIDEAHHASEESSSREDVGAYATVIEALPDAGIACFTATNFRGDGDRLHPRIEAAHREVVGIDEARQAGRIVPPKTVLGRARIADGRTPREVMDSVDAGRETREASAIISDGKGDAFWGQVVHDWVAIARERQTIVFTERTDEVDALTARFEEEYGEGVAVALHGSQPDWKNDQAFDAYGKGQAKVIVACKKIDEGYDVPATDCVMVTNASLSRAQMNQYAGRALRARPGKEEGLFIDYGISTLKHGEIEHQHEMQNVDAMATLRGVVAGARVLARATPKAPDETSGWRCMPGEKKSIFLNQRAPGKYLVLELDADSKSRGKTGPGRNLSRVGKGDISLSQVTRMIADQTRAEAGSYAKMGGFSGAQHGERGAALLKQWRKNLDLYSPNANEPAWVNEAHKRQGEIVEATIRGDEDMRGRDTRLVRKALMSKDLTARQSMEMALVLTGVALHATYRHDKAPPATAHDAGAVGESLLGVDVKAMGNAELKRVSMAAARVMKEVAVRSQDDGARAAMKHLLEPIVARIPELPTRAASQRGERVA
jgi:superfamily II DNA or RNA helicase